MLRRSFISVSSLYCRRYTTAGLAQSLDSATLELNSEKSSSSSFPQSKRPDPPLVLKLREDLKTALQNKDTERLSVIRSLIDAAHKRPPSTDFQMDAIIRRYKQDSEKASEHYKIAERPDLVAKQDLHTQILGEYSNQVSAVEPEKVQQAVAAVFEEMKRERPRIRFNEFLRRSFKHPILADKEVHRGDVVRAVRDILNAYEAQELGESQKPGEGSATS